MTAEELILKIKADVSDFESSMGKMKETSQKATNDINSQFKQVASQIGLAFGIGAIVKFAKESVNAFKETEQSAMLLDHTLKTIGVSDSQIAQVEQFVNTLEQTTHYDDSEIRKALQDLTLKFGDANVAMKVLTVSMEASRARGEDLATTTSKISLGLLGNTRALKEYGIVANDNMSQMEVLNAIYEKTSGSIATFGDTAAGASENLKISLGNLKETIGSSLTPAISGLIDGFAGQIAMMTAASAAGSDYAKQTKQIGKDIGAVAGGIFNTAVNLFTTIISGINLVGQAIKGLLTEDFASISLAFGTFKETIKEYGNIWKGVSDTIQGNTVDTKTVVKNVMDDINNAIADSLGSLNKTLGEAKGKTTDTASAVKKQSQDTKNKISEDANKVSEDIQKANEDWFEKLKATQEKQKDLENKLVEFLRDKYTLERDAKISSIEKERDAVINAIQAEIDARYNQYLQEISFIDATSKEQINSIQNELKQMAAQREQQQRQEWMAQKQQELLSAETAEERAKIEKEIQKQLSDWAYEDTRNSLQQQIEDIRNSAEKQKELAKEEYEADRKILEQKMEDTKASYDKMLEDAKTFYDNLLLERNLELEKEKMLVLNTNEEIMNMLNETLGDWSALGAKIGDAYWSNLMGAISDMTSLYFPETREVGGHTGVPHLAGGGLISSPTLAMIGEREPEYVVPQSQMGVNVTYNIYGASDMNTLRRVLREHDQELLNSLRGGK